MQSGLAYLGAVVCLTVAVMVTESSSLDTDISTKLAELTEQMIKMSGQLSTLSKQQQEQAGQLSTLSEQQSQTSGEVSKLSKKMTELTDQHAATTSSGPVFVRWGRKTCSETGSDILYTGVAGGSLSVDKGGGADLLCLPRDPSYANYDNVNQPNSSHLVVAEYKLDPASNFPFENNNPLLLDEDVPCAVCEVTNGSSVMMIPARVDCYSGWRLEYRGYLMTETYNTYRSDFVCVDANPEVDYGGGGSATYSVGLYPVETRCNYLPCPPFESWAETACVVCSK